MNREDILVEAKCEDCGRKTTATPERLREGPIKCAECWEACFNADPVHVKIKQALERK